MQTLQTYDPSLAQAQKDNVIKSNFTTLNTAMQFQGASVIGTNISQSSASVGTSLGSTPYNGSISASGGLSVLLGQFCFTMGSNSGNITLQLSVDGTVQSTVISGAPASTAICIPLMWAGSLNSGNHTVQVQASASVSGVTFNGSANSGYTVIENRQG